MITKAQKAVLLAAASGERVSFAGSAPAWRSCVKQGWIDASGSITEDGLAVLAGTGGLILRRVKVAVNLTPDQAERLARYAEARGMSVSAAIRQWVDSLP